MERQAREYFRRIEDLGGVLPAIEAGFLQGEIADSAFRYQREIDEKRRLIVGVNAYQDEQPLRIPLLEMDPAGFERQAERLRRLRAERDAGAVGQALDRLRVACQGTENTMPHILQAVRAYATLGEIIGVMRDVFGTYTESARI
jgi:methylmalonyl-CoA mutase N-terminal domain/subunit